MLISRYLRRTNCRIECVNLSLTNLVQCMKLHLTSKNFVMWLSCFASKCEKCLFMLFTGSSS